MKKITTLRPAGIFATSLVASLFLLSTINAQTPSDDAASPEAPQVASKPKYPEFYNDEKLAFYRDPRYAKPLPEGIFGMRTITVPEDGFHNDKDRELYVGLQGVADVLSQARSFDGLARKLEPYSQAIFGAETTDYYGDKPLDEHFRGGVHYQDHHHTYRVFTSYPEICDALTVCHVDGYIVFDINKTYPFHSEKQIELNGNWQVGEIARIYVFYFDSREAVEITFHADGSPQRFRRCEFADAPSSFTPLLRRPGKEAQRTDAQQQKLIVDALKTVHPTLVLYSTVWNRDGSVAERVNEPTDVTEMISLFGAEPAPFKFSEWVKGAEEAVAKEAAEKTE